MSKPVHLAVTSSVNPEWAALRQDLDLVLKRLKLLDTCIFCGSDVQHGHSNRYIEFTINNYIRSRRIEKVCPACELHAARYGGGFENGVYVQTTVGAKQ